MKIISKFTDYYDTAQCTGFDDYVKYIRIKDQTNKQSSILEQTLKQTPSSISSNTYPLQYVVTPLLLLFCNAGYTYYKITSRYYNERLYPTSVHDKVYYCYSIKDIQDTLKVLGLKQELIEYNRSRSSKELVAGINRRVPFCRDAHVNMDWVFDITDVTCLRDLQINLNSPLVSCSLGKEYIPGGVWDERRRFVQVTCSPVLKDIEFYRVVDCYTAFQEIEMFIGGVLGTCNDPAPRFSDKVMRDSKGFDKWSFKTMPGTKKPRKRNRNK